MDIINDDQEIELLLDSFRKNYESDIYTPTPRGESKHNHSLSRCESEMSISEYTENVYGHSDIMLNSNIDFEDHKIKRPKIYIPSSEESLLDIIEETSSEDKKSCAPKSLTSFIKKFKKLI